MKNSQDAKLLTFHNAENYGAALQAYALKETLNGLGLNASFVNYENKKILSDYKLIKTNSLKSFFSSLWYMPRNLKRKKSFKSFGDKYLDLKTKKYYSREDIEKDICDNDLFIAGSDQIWNPTLTDGLSDVYTLNFRNKNINKVIYGASLGNEELLNKYKKDFSSKLGSLKNISVREKSIITSLQNILNKEVVQVLDPTLLLNRLQWDNLLQTNNTLDLESKKYILVYTLFEDDKITKMTDFISEKTGLKVIHFRKYNAYKNELRSLYSYGPIEFVNAFKNATYIVTNSFHGTVFSIIFEKKFYSVLPETRAGRIKDLLHNLNLDSRIIQNTHNIDLESDINYTLVKENMEKLKSESKNFLKKGVT